MVGTRRIMCEGKVAGGGTVPGISPDLARDTSDARIVHRLSDHTAQRSPFSLCPWLKDVRDKSKFGYEPFSAHSCFGEATIRPLSRRRGGRRRCFGIGLETLCKDRQCQHCCRVCRSDKSRSRKTIIQYYSDNGPTSLCGGRGRPSHFSATVPGADPMSTSHQVLWATHSRSMLTANCPSTRNAHVRRLRFCGWVSDIPITLTKNSIISSATGFAGLDDHAKGQYAYSFRRAIINFLESSSLVDSDVVTRSAYCAILNRRTIPMA